MKRTLLAIFAVAALSLTSYAADFEHKGIHIAQLTQVMTPEALHTLADKVAAAGLNTIIMEWEGSFPFKTNATACEPYTYSREEVKEFISYCNSLGIDVIPLQNCFGHVAYILANERYRHLSESSEYFHSTCASCGDESDEIYKSMFEDIFELHTSKYVHIGADEVQLGLCPRCKAYVAEHGTSALFVEYLNRMCKIVLDMGKIPIIWADVAQKHPEELSKLPKELIFMDWNYGWALDKFGGMQPAFDLGFEVWGAGSIRCYPDNTYLTDWTKHLNNFRDFVPYCREHNYNGMIVTSWSSSGSMEFISDDAEGTVNVTHTIRQLYPLSGFDVLLSGFGQACNSEQTFDPHAYIRQYAADRFGCDEKGQDAFEEYIFTQQKIVSMKELTHDNVCSQLAATCDAKRALTSFKPRKNRTEYKHHRLMLDIRLHYLSFMKVYSQFEAPTFTIDQAPQLRDELKPVYKKIKNLRRRYKRMNSWYIKDWDVTLGNLSYMHKLETVMGTLEALSRSN